MNDTPKPLSPIEKKLAQNQQSLVDFEGELSDFMCERCDEFSTISSPDSRLIFRHEIGDVAIIVGDFCSVDPETRSDILGFIAKKLPKKHSVGVIQKQR